MELVAMAARFFITVSRLDLLNIDEMKLQTGDIFGNMFYDVRSSPNVEELFITLINYE